MPSVFLSSTFIEMEEYRQAATEAITSYQHACIRMEDFPASSRTIPEFCREKVKECDLFVLILGRYYGTLMPGSQISYTEDEFETAVKLRKPCLVFLLGVDPQTHKEAQTNVQEAIDRMEDEGMNPVVQKQLQRDFSRRANQGVTPRLFSDPDDLKFQVAHAITEHFRSTVRPVPRAGEKLVLLCDRSDQLDRFADSFEAGVPGRPEIYVIHGPEQEQHRHCVERMVCFHISYPKRNSADMLLAPPQDRALIDWPRRFSSEDTEDILFNRLCRKLFQALSLEAAFSREKLVESFCQLAGSVKTPYLHFRHTLWPEDWSPETQQLCRRYLKFWADVGDCFGSWPADRKQPRLLIFFEFIHTFDSTPAVAPGDAGISASPGADTPAALFQRSLHSVFEERRPAGITSKVLPPLPRVQWPQLDTWYQRYERLLLPQYQNRQVTELFPDAPLPMAKVERRLGTMLGLEGYAD